MIGVVLFLAGPALYATFYDIRPLLNFLIDEHILIFLLTIGVFMFSVFLLCSFVLNEDGRLKEEIRVISLFITAISVMLFGIEKQETKNTAEVDRLIQEYDDKYEAYFDTLSAIRSENCSLLSFSAVGQPNYRDVMADRQTACILSNQYMNLVSDKIRSQSKRATPIAISDSIINETKSSLIIIQYNAINLFISELEHVSEEFKSAVRQQNVTKSYTRNFGWVVFLFAFGTGLEAANEFRKRSMAMLRKLRLRAD